MRDIPLEDCIIRIAELLKLPELEIVLVLRNSFEQGALSDEAEETLEELYWEFFK